MSDWIKHDGDGMPVDPNKMVLVRWRNGEVHGPLQAAEWQIGGKSPRDYWEHPPRSQMDIVEYCIVEPSA